MKHTCEAVTELQKALAVVFNFFLKETDLMATQDEIKTKLSGVSDKIDSLATDSAALMTTVGEAATDIADIDTDLDRVRQLVEDIRNTNPGVDLTELDTLSQSLVNKVGPLSDQFATFKTQADELKSRADAVKTESADIA